MQGKLRHDRLAQPAKERLLGKHKRDSANDLRFALQEIDAHILLLPLEMLFNPVEIAVNGMVVKTIVTFPPAL